MCETDRWLHRRSGSQPYAQRMRRGAPQPPRFRPNRPAVYVHTHTRSRTHTHTHAHTRKQLARHVRTHTCAHLRLGWLNASQKALQRQPQLLLEPCVRLLGVLHYKLVRVVEHLGPTTEAQVVQHEALRNAKVERAVKASTRAFLGDHGAEGCLGYTQGPTLNRASERNASEHQWHRPRAWPHPLRIGHLQPPQISSEQKHPAVPSQLRRKQSRALPGMQFGVTGCVYES